MSSSVSAAAKPCMIGLLRLPALNSCSCLTRYSGCCCASLGLAGMPRVAVGAVAGGAAAGCWPAWRCSWCRPWRDRAWRPWRVPQRPAWRRARRRAKLALAAARQQGSKQQGRATSYGGLDLWRKTPRFYNGAPFRTLIDDHPTAHAGHSLLPHGPAVEPRPPNASASRAAGCTPPASSPPRPSSSTCRRSSCPRSPSSAARTPASRPRINTLTQQKRLAFASKTPGRTQHINLFGVGKQKVDRRGAGRPARLRLRGGARARPSCAGSSVMANYLMTRENLRGVVLMCDPRHGLTELDDILLDVDPPAGRGRA